MDKNYLHILWRKGEVPVYLTLPKLSLQWFALTLQVAPLSLSYPSLYLLLVPFKKIY